MGIDFGCSGSYLPDPALMENMEFNIRDRKLHIIPIWVNATNTIHEEIVLRLLHCNLYIEVRVNVSKSSAEGMSKNTRLY